MRVHPGYSTFPSFARTAGDSGPAHMVRDPAGIDRFEPVDRRAVFQKVRKMDHPIRSGFGVTPCPARWPERRRTASRSPASPSRRRPAHSSMRPASAGRRNGSRRRRSTPASRLPARWRVVSAADRRSGDDASEGGQRQAVEIASVQCLLLHRGPRHGRET